MRNYTDRELLEWGTRNKQFYNERARKNWHYNSNFAFFRKWFRSHTNPKAPEADEVQIPFMGVGARNGSRSPPGLTNRPIASGAKPGARISNMSPQGQMIGQNPPLRRRKSEATNHAGDDSAPHHHKGGKKWEWELRPDPHGAIFEIGIW